MEVIWIGLAAFLGGIVAAVLGWLPSEEDFVPKKFMASVVRALIGGVVIAVGYSYTNFLTPIDIGVAFLAGAGVDVIGKRASKAIVANFKR